MDNADPTVLRGTLRSNLDPFDLCTDEEILAVLRQVRLVQSPTGAPTEQHQQHDAVSPPPPPSPPHLDTPISSSSSPFSLGQHQLICLARALLRRPTILIMDEATASIDHATDEHLQKVVMDLKCTVITIAHRLKTIMEYERVVVLDGGAVVEVVRRGKGVDYI